MTHDNSGSNKLLIIEKVLLLQSTAIFRETPEPILAEVAKIIREKEVSSGTEIFREGEIGGCMFIIHQGEVSIHKNNQVLGLKKERDCFGEMSLLDAERRSASATANTDCLLLQLDQEPFYELMESSVEVARGVIRTLCNQIREQNEKLISLQRS